MTRYLSLYSLIDSWCIGSILWLHCILSIYPITCSQLCSEFWCHWMNVCLWSSVPSDKYISFRKVGIDYKIGEKNLRHITSLWSCRHQSIHDFPVTFDYEDISRPIARNVLREVRFGVCGFFSSQTLTVLTCFWVQF